VHPISAVQSEYSLWERSLEEQVIPACRELGVGIVPYCPLGRGFLAGQARRGEDYAAEGDMRGHMPRFQGENFDRNSALLATLVRIASRVGATPAQLALAWLLRQGQDIVPIPGTKRRRWLEENAAAAALNIAQCDLFSLEEAFPRGAAAGPRYSQAHMRMVDAS
jgi:aryl-alcohol dehydrogenase-like predicted oxidoreductase